MRPMLGFATDDRCVFTELGSGAKHLNFYNEWETYITMGFEVLNNLYDVMDMFEKEDAREALEEFWREFEEFVFFFSVEEEGDEPGFSCLSAEDFFKEYVSGRLTPIEYQKKLTRKANNIINLFEKKD